MREAVSLRLFRAVAVLAVLAGVLAMHGLATAHHGAGAAPLLPAVPAADVTHGHPDVDTAPAGAADGDCSLACKSQEHGLVLLCVVALLAAGAGVLLLRRRAGSLRQAAPPRRARAPSSRRPRSFDLVAELCVNRT